MKDMFARAIGVSDSRNVKVSELPGGGFRIEGVTRTFEGEFQSGGVCFSPEAVEALIKMLKEWEKNNTKTTSKSS